MREDSAQAQLHFPWRRERLLLLALFGALFCGFSGLGAAQMLQRQVDTSSQATQANSPAEQSAPQRGTSGPDTGMPLSPDPLTPNPRQHLDSAGLSRGNEERDLAPLTPEPSTPFQLLVQATTGNLLPLFGRSLFSNRFQALPYAPPPTDYVVTTGDQVLVRMWGPVTMNEALTVDRAGDIYLPQVGIVHVAGLPYSALAGQIRQGASRVFRNFNLAVNLGSLHSIQVFVTGQAARPGSYTISSLSTLVNAVFASGGPSQAGSLRGIELRRDAHLVTSFDFYDLLLNGDKSRDAHLLPGDVIFIPPVGPQVALGGEAKVPAIYELRPGDTLGTLLHDAGGVNSIASGTSVSLEQIVAHRAREARQLPLTPSGLATPLQDGDLLIVGAISHRFENTVSIRGNLANPGRFAWRAGMRLSEIIPEKASLLTPDYWNYRNAEGHRDTFFASATENEPAAPPATEAAPLQNPGTITMPGTPNPVVGVTPEPGAGTISAPEARPLNRIRIPAPEIDWSYAVIERTDHDTLRHRLLPFNLGKLVLDHDASVDLPLEPGDVVTIFSQDDFRVADNQRTKFIRIEGEVTSAGVYSVLPGETLQSLVVRAGGLSPQAYLFGSQFTRESTRLLQQQRMDEYANRLSIDMERSAAKQSVAFSQGGSNDTLLSLEDRLLQQIRAQRATGRIVLDFKYASEGVASIPPLALENGDVLVVPSRPAVVNVIGSVSTQSSFLFEPGATVRHYLAIAGGPERESDVRHAFVIRASGAVVSRRSAGFLEDSFNNLKLDPGDTLVVPSKLFTASRLRTVLDSSTAISQLALVAATLAVIH